MSIDLQGEYRMSNAERRVVNDGKGGLRKEGALDFVIRMFAIRNWTCFLTGPSEANVEYRMKNVE